MGVLNRIVGGAAVPVFAALAPLPPLAQVALLSLVLAVVVLLAFKWTSNPARIDAAKRRMQAGFFEVRLLNHDMRSMLRAQGDILRHNADYLRASALPILCTFLPMLLVMAQMQSVYGYRSVRPGEAFLFTIEMAAPAAMAASSARPDVRLEVPAGLRVDAGAVWIPSRRECVWRLHAERPGPYRLTAHFAGAALTKDVVVGGAGTRLSPLRQKPSFVAQLLYPVEPPLPAAAAIDRMHVAYAPASLVVFGRDTPWLLVCFVLVAVFALLLKGRFRVVL